MSIKIFISSEMNTPDDKQRRIAAVSEIRDLGHFPVHFEELPARPLTKDSDILENCRKQVRKSDMLFAIIDDTISSGMEEEINEAKKTLGDRNIIFYFTKAVRRDFKAKMLWDTLKQKGPLIEFNTTDELKREIRRSFAHFIDDILETNRAFPCVINESISLLPGQEWKKEFNLTSGDIVTITCIGNCSFFMYFVSRVEYVKLRPHHSDYEICPPQSRYTSQEKIDKTDDYYLILRKSQFYNRSVKVDVKVRCERE